MPLERALQLGPTFMAELAKLTPAAMLLFDQHLEPIDCNPAFVRLTGRQHDSQPFECFSRDELERVREALERRQADEPIRWPGRVQTLDGYWREVEIVVVFLMGYSLMVMLDVTDSRRLGRKLEALNRFSSAVTLSTGLEATLDLLAAQVVAATDAVAAVVLLLDPGPRIDRVGRAGVPGEVLEAAFQMFASGIRVPAFEAYETGQTLVVPPQQREEFLAGTRLGELVEAQGWQHLVCVPLGKGVMNCFFTERLLPTPDDLSFLETLGRFATVAIENARLFAEAEERAVAEERQRLGRELHDSVSQSLYSIGLGAQAALAALEAGSPDETRQTIDYILSLARSGLDDMRALLFKLRPEVLDDEGLVVALTRQAESLRVRYGLIVELDLGEEPPLSPSIRHALYRIASEALHNAIKHSRATRLRVSLKQRQRQVELEIEDNGEGFVPEGCNGGLGLTTMRERAAEAGGQLQVQSEPGQGARLLTTIPV
ncbi:MAG: histidine kinase [Vulcanimicrobiota bacterium]